MNVTPNFGDNWREMVEWVRENRNNGRKIVFTNGCYDVLHPGHILFLKSIHTECESKFGGKGTIRLIVGLNSDSSVRELKGPTRPILTYKRRAYMMQALKMVDAVCRFNEPTPLKVVETIVPDVLAKGGDYSGKEIVGEKCVIENGGIVLKKYFLDGFSSGTIMAKMVKAVQNQQ
jgi:D-beta-D-heptose 7-phosphate kinase/D-beta-D-heptose 1-phosphate adenosyltransferase